MARKVSPEKRALRRIRENLEVTLVAFIVDVDWNEVDGATYYARDLLKAYRDACRFEDRRLNDE